MSLQLLHADGMHDLILLQNLKKPGTPFGRSLAKTMQYDNGLPT
jgi:hypothetical protein